MTKLVQFYDYIDSNKQNIKCLDLNTAKIILKDNSCVEFLLTDASQDLFFYFDLSSKGIDILGLENYHMSVRMDKKKYKKFLFECKHLKIICKNMNTLLSVKDCYLRHRGFASVMFDRYNIMKSNINEYVMYKHDLRKKKTYMALYNYNLENEYMYRWVSLELKPLELSINIRREPS